ncbi:gamma-glutamyl-gamma-aminobutyrate hydrolase family protein [Guggenheimella bovis]
MKKILVCSQVVKVEDRTLLGANKVVKDALVESGALPLFTTSYDLDLIDEYIELCDGVLFIGGEGVAPFYFGEEPTRPKVIHFERDQFEIALFHKAVECKKPILGICRGAHLINVALQGTLEQDVQNAYEGVIHKGDGEHPIYHSIKIEADSLLHSLYGSRLIVNSNHTMAIKTLGTNLKATAFSPDGLIEAFEDRDRSIFGVQFHPEYVSQNREFSRIFDAFVNTL